LKDSSYCSIDLPPYVTFNKILSKIEKYLVNHRVSDCFKEDPNLCNNVNHVIYSNKDGKYAWRPLQLIHPVLYVDLINKITEPKHWKVIKKSFNLFFNNKRIKCLSVPVESLSVEKDKAEQISQWWHDVEQKSIAMSLDYDHLLQTDISDCYGSIYTHSIAWALHGIRKTKRSRDKKLLGNIIDSHLRRMSYGQTNGIPQGSVVMDFIAELLLGYADLLLSKELKKLKINDYCILRYRDDYRIFTNNSQEGENITKALTEVLIGLGLKLSSIKTKASSCVIRDSIKSDKLSWIGKKQTDKNLLKYLLLIHEHALAFPNAGSTVVALSEYHKKIVKLQEINGLDQLIAVTADIAYHNPKVYPVTAAILSKFISLLHSGKEKFNYIKRILKRFENIPNTGYMEIWLQRILLHSSFNKSTVFKETVCKLVSGVKVQIWNSAWISSVELKSLMDATMIIDYDKIKALDVIISTKEIEMYVSKKDYIG
jgi:hypothetical protein